MTNYIQLADEIAERTMLSPAYAEVCMDMISVVGDVIRRDVENGLVVKGDDMFTTPEEAIAFFLIRDAINFCFWYGGAQHNIETCGSGHLSQDVLSSKFVCGMHGPMNFSEIPSWIWYLKQQLTRKRFTMLRERFQNLDELSEHSNWIGLTFIPAILNGASVEKVMAMLVECLPISFGSDPLLKRASLFCLEIYKQRNNFLPLKDVFGGTVSDLPVPVDYHLPNVLWELGVLEHSEILEAQIELEVHLESGSKEEAEIRCSTYLACRHIQKHLGCTSDVIDLWLFNKRAECSRPHHLTKTTDY